MQYDDDLLSLDNDPRTRSVLRGALGEAMDEGPSAGRREPILPATPYAQVRDRLLARIDAEREPQAKVLSMRTRVIRGPRNRTRLSGWLGATACVAIALIAVWRVPSFRTVLWHASTTTAVPTSRIYTTRLGERATLKLPDGTRVMLAPHTRLVVPSLHNMVRMVTLTGEAYFDVAPSVKEPFAVRTGRSITRVLGTTFDIRRYDTETNTRVIVAAGKVEVRVARTRQIVTAGMTAQCSDSTVHVIATDGRAGIAWTGGRLVFNGTPVPAMLEELSRWYGYTFRLADSSLAQAHVRAEFHVGEPEETMLLLKSVLNATLTVDGTVVTVHARSGHFPAAMRPVAPTQWSTPMEAGK